MVALADLNSVDEVSPKNEEVAFTVRTPVEETNLRFNDDVAPPPNFPKRSWVSTPLANVEPGHPVHVPVICILVVVIFVEETFARDDEPTVKTPVELEKVKPMEDVAPPPSMP